MTDTETIHAYVGCQRHTLEVDLNSRPVRARLTRAPLVEGEWITVTDPIAGGRARAKVDAVGPRGIVHLDVDWDTFEQT